MEVKILDKKDNLFFNRTEIFAEINHQGLPTPKRAEVRKLLAEVLGASSELLVIRRCKSQFGFKAVCEAMLYKSKQDLEKFEPKYIIGRETGQKLHKVKSSPAAGATTK
ncbi:MAG: 30S ribosomal protein S24e [Candidatus Nanoarchaeia archaeon]